LRPANNLSGVGRQSAPSCFRGFQIAPDETAAGRPTLKLQWGDAACPRFAYFPNVAGTYLLVLPKRGRSALELSASPIALTKLDPIAALLARLRGLWIKKKNILDFDSFRVFIGGPKPARRVLVAATNYLRELGTPLDGAAIERHPELILGWGPGGVALPSPAAPLGASNARVAIVLHLYYGDLWPEFSAVLKSLPLAFDLVVTTVTGGEKLVDEIHADFPQATTRVVENRGRDVGPFLLLLEEGVLDAYDCVCKIHSKKTLRALNRNPYGEVWRRRLLFDLLCAEGTMVRAVERFERNPSLGLLGPEVFRITEAEVAGLSWKVNLPLVSKLLMRLGKRPDQIQPDFFAGSMFWFRPKALTPLRALRLSQEFEGDQGKRDGALEHAVERTFSNVVTAAGYEVEEINGLRP
jgi:hypothetical protein